MPPSFSRPDDLTLIALNSAGLSLKSIAKRLDLHHTTVTKRLQTLEIPVADTRRAFMEEIYDSLTPAQQEWLLSQLGPGRSIKGFVRALIVKEFITHQKAPS